ncbi:MAG: hypothetical protein VX277_01095 [Candidatus Thermoplasmatota archaeon]|nr:hypothetical protein [Candidatus Thermoplasmatota archaeon]
MGNVSVLTNVTLKQLKEEAPVRWPTLWDDTVERTTCLILLPRKSRPEMEQHGFFVEHKYPVFGLFYRPRDEANTLRSRGIDPLSASYQFLDIAVSDLELWVKELVSNQDYELVSTIIEPLPSNAISSIRLAFESFEMSTYAHKSLDYFGSLPLVMPPSSLVSKAFLSIPDIVPIALENNIQEETPTIEEETPTIEEETPTITDIKEIVEEKEVLESKVEEKPTTAPRAIVEEQKSLPGVGVEAEFRMIVQKLMGEGYDSNAIMENIEFQDISDRATAAGVNTWELFLKLAT